jgi:hypothetical protein
MEFFKAKNMTEVHQVKMFMFFESFILTLLFCFSSVYMHFLEHTVLSNVVYKTYRKLVNLSNNKEKRAQFHRSSLILRQLIFKLIGKPDFPQPNPKMLHNTAYPPAPLPPLPSNRQGVLIILIATIKHKCFIF